VTHQSLATLFRLFISLDNGLGSPARSASAIVARLRWQGTLNAMASYLLDVKTFSGGKGSSATKPAAYRSGERIRDARSGAVHDYADRTDVAHAEIMQPAEYAGHTNMGWAVQQSGRRCNARLAREVLVHLPPEMTLRNAWLWLDAFHARWRYHSAVDFAVHGRRAQAAQRHHHAHILTTTRQVSRAGIGARTTLEKHDETRFDILH
jgi:MobA/MobL family